MIDATGGARQLLLFGRYRGSPKRQIDPAGLAPPQNVANSRESVLADSRVATLRSRGGT